MQLTASGGTTPYTWIRISGSLPVGLGLSASGLISGTATRSGTYSFVVQVFDSSGNSNNNAVKRLSLTVTGAGSPSQDAPVITRIKVKKNKKLSVYGTYFTGDSLIILNGEVLVPRSFRLETTEQRLKFKGQLNLRPQGTNVITVAYGSVQSAPFFF